MDRGARHRPPWAVAVWEHPAGPTEGEIPQPRRPEQGGCFLRARPGVHILRAPQRRYVDVTGLLIQRGSNR